MSIVYDLYPMVVDRNGDLNWISDYTPIVESFGKVVVRVDEDNYQGDSYVYYHEGDKHGVLVFGWGSCSGCDALQACKSIKDIEELIESLRKNIRWFDSASSLYNWINDKEYHKTQYHYHVEDWDRFVKLTNEALTKYIVEEKLVKDE
jgi:thioredoxin-related protein